MANRAPQSGDGAAQLTLALGVVSDATALGAHSFETEYTFVGSGAFNINFDDSDDPDDPTNTAIFAAGIQHTFQPGSAVSHFRAVSPAASVLKYWRSKD